MKIKMQKLVWKGHSDTFITNSPIIVKKKDSKLEKSNRPSHNQKIFDDLIKPSDKYSTQPTEDTTTMNQNNKIIDQDHLPHQEVMM